LAGPPFASGIMQCRHECWSLMVAPGWTRLDERPGGAAVVLQRHVDGCGAACVEMLLRDQGICISQDVIANELPMPSTAAEIAACLSGFSSNRAEWVGGVLDVEPPASLELLLALGEHGSWGALLLWGREGLGHWVVVDEVSPRAVTVRDPEGTTYAIPFSEFQQLIGYLVVVFQRGGGS
jgi:filamentous hemagglutinin